MDYLRRIITTGFLLLPLCTGANAQEATHLYRQLPGEKEQDPVVFLNKPDSLMKAADEIEHEFPDSALALYLQASEYMKYTIPGNAGERDFEERYELIRKAALFLLGVRQHDKALDLAGDLHGQALQMQDDSLRADALKILGVIHMAREEHYIARRYMLESIGLYRTFNDSLNIANNYNNLGILYNRKYYFSLALDAYTKALSVWPAEKREHLEYVTLVNIGILHRLLEDYQQAETFLERSLTTEEMKRDTGVMGLALGELGYVQYKKGSYDSALEILENAISVLHPRRNKTELYNLYLKYGLCLMQLHDLERSSYYLHQALKHFAEVQEDRHYNESLLAISQLFSRKGEHERAVFYARRAKRLALEYNRYHIGLDANDLLIREKLALGDLSGVSGLLDDQRALSKSLRRADSSQSLAEMKLKFMLENQNRELNIEKLQLEKENEHLARQKAESEKKASQRNLLIALGLLLLVLTGTIARFSFRRKKLLGELTEKNKKISQQYHTLEVLKERIEKQRDSIARESRAAEMLNSQLVNAADDSIVLIGPEGELLRANPASYCCLGYREEHKIAFNRKAIVHPGDLPLLSDYEITLKEKGMINLELRIRHRKGHYLTFHMKAIRLYEEESGKMIGDLIVGRDITQQKQFNQRLQKAKEKAEESDRLKTAFLANVSHEIRTPLNAIVGFSGLIAQDKISESKRRHFHHIIRQNSQQLVTLINDILDLSKIESNQLVIAKKQTCLKDLMTDLQTVFEKKIGSDKDIELKLEVPEGYDHFTLTTDPARLNQILGNLLDNALKFTEKGTVRCGFENHKPDDLLFYVKDTGPGILKKNQQLIFDYFRQEQRPEDTRVVRGTGIGLSICKQLTQLLGGTIWVESEPEKGAAFYFTLPLS